MSSFFGRQATGKVVSMERFRSGKSLSPIHQAEAYWSALRDGAGIPRRTQIDPRGLENILQFAFIVERIAPGIARFRLAGSHLSELAGMEVRGMPLTSFFTPAARVRIGAVLEHMFDAPAVAELTLTSEAKRRRPMVEAPVIEARMILLPLENEAGEVTRALGVLVADEVPGDDTALRFDLGATALRPVTGVLAAPRPDRRSERRPESLPEILAENQPVEGFGEDQEPLAGPVPHLRLVK